MPSKYQTEQISFKYFKILYNLKETNLHSAISRNQRPIQTFSCLRIKSRAEKYDVYLNHKNMWSENNLKMTKLK